MNADRPSPTVHSALNSPNAIYNRALELLEESGGDSLRQLEAFVLLERSALMNHHGSLYQCGVMLEEGQGVDVDLEQSKSFYEKAASEGHGASQFRLGRILYKERTAEGDRRSKSLLESSAVQGIAKSYYYLGKMALRGLDSGVRDAARAFDYFRQGAAAHELSCLLRCASMHSLGEGTREDKGQSVLLLIEGSLNQDAVSLYQLGQAMLHGDGCPRDESGGWENIAQSSDLGHRAASVAYGIHLCECGNKRDGRLGILHLERALRFPDDGSSHYWFGRYCLHLFRDESAMVERGVDALQQSIAVHYLPAFYELGKYYFDLGESSKGALLYEYAARQHYAPVCLDYARRIYQGDYDAQGLERARSLFREAAQQSESDESGEAFFFYAQMLERGEGGAADWRGALKAYEDSHRRGYTPSCYPLAQHYLSNGTAEERDRSIELLVEGVQENDSNCMVELGRVYESNECDDGVAEGAEEGDVRSERESGRMKEERAARTLYLRASRLGNADGILLYSKMCMDGRGGARRLSEAWTWNRRGANLGNVDCLFNLGYLSEIGARDSEEDKAASAEAGDGSSSSSGDEESEEKLCPPDYERARRFYREAMSKGHVKALVNYGYLLAEGLGGERDTLEALKCYSKAGAHNDSQALFNEAVLRQRIHPESPGAFRELLQQSASLGHPLAKFNLATLLMSSHQPEDLRLCRRYMRESFQEGVLPACHGYAYVLHHGIGGQEYPERARQVLEDGARRGDRKSQSMLSEFLHDGIGGQAEPDQAEYWRGRSSQGDAVSPASELEDGDGDEAAASPVVQSIAAEAPGASYASSSWRCCVQ